MLYNTTENFIKARYFVSIPFFSLTHTYISFFSLHFALRWLIDLFIYLSIYLFIIGNTTPMSSISGITLFFFFSLFLALRVSVCVFVSLAFPPSNSVYVTTYICRGAFKCQWETRRVLQSQICPDVQGRSF